MIGQIDLNGAREIAEKIKDFKGVFIVSSDLSHFLSYEKAVKKDKETIKILEDLDFSKLEKMDACGQFPLMVLMELCKIKKWRPKLIEYKNSGDITGERESVVGYASIRF